MFDRARRIGKALAEHACGYAELLAAEAAEAAPLIRRRLVLNALAAGCGVLSGLFALLWVIAATWDGPYRLWTIGGFVVLFGLGAVGCATAAGSRKMQLFSRLRLEWAADRALFNQVIADRRENYHS
jgi:uncharacterized membrane protein YqjE